MVPSENSKKNNDKKRKKNQGDLARAKIQTSIVKAVPKTVPDIEEIKKKEFKDIPKIKEEAAREIARYLVIGFIVMLLVPYLYLFTGTVAEVIDLMKTVAAVLSGLVGAIFGYYFRRGKSE